jgi:hypothetical protein
MNHKKYTRIVLLSSLVATTALQAQAQNKLGTNPTNINTNAIFELESSNKGMLMPRLALTATNSASPLSAFTAGMVVYNTASAGTGATAVTPGYYYCDGTKWVQMADAAARNTPFYLQGSSTVDIGENKDTIMWRTGSVAIGNATSTTTPNATANGRSLAVLTNKKTHGFATTHVAVEAASNLSTGEDITGSNYGVLITSNPAANIGSSNYGISATSNPTGTITASNFSAQLTASPSATITGNNNGLAVTASPTGSAAVNYGANITTGGTATLSNSNRALSVTNSFGGSAPNVYGIFMTNNLAATASITSSNIGISNAASPVSGSTIGGANYGINSSVSPAGSIGTSNYGINVDASPTGSVANNNFGIRSTAISAAGTIGGANYGVYGAANLSGSAGVGASNYASYFDASPTSTTAIPGSNYGLVAVAVPTTTISGTNYGISTSARATNASSNVGINVSTATDGATIPTQHTGIYVSNTPSNSTIGAFRGIYLNSSPKNSTINDDYYGFYLASRLDTNSVSNVDQYGIYVSNSHMTGSTVNGNSYGMRLSTNTAGTVNGNIYGIFLEGPGTSGTVSGRRYGFYQGSGNALNAMLGMAQIGGNSTDSAISELTVIGTGDVTNGITVVNTTADAFSKQGMLKTLQYNSAEPPLLGMHIVSNTAGNSVNIGGNTVGHASPNFIRFYTDADGVTSTTPNNLAMSISGNDVGIGIASPSERLDVRGKVRIDGSNMIIGFDSLRYSTNGLRITGRAGTDLPAALTLMPSGTATRSTLRMYSGSDPSNVGWSELSTSDSTLTIGGSFIGTGKAANTMYVNNMNVGIGTATPQAALHVAGTGAIIIPVGNTTSRPTTPVQGMIRYNTTLSKFEGYDGTAWVLLN